MSEIFRKKSLDRVNSPTDLNEYMRVTNPPIWFALICVIALFIGAFFWGVTAKLETTVKAVAVNTENGVTCYIRAENIDDVKAGTIVRIENAEYVVTEIGKEIMLPNSVLNDYEMNLADLKNGESIYPVLIEGEVLEKTSQADVVLETVSPIYFLLGSKD